MDLTQLRTLVTLADWGSLKRAASRLYLSPAAVHRQLKLLSEEIGEPLYERINGQLRLTAPARRILPLARDLLQKADGLRELVLGKAGRLGGYLRVGCSPTFATYRLPRLVTRFRERFPDADLLVETDQGPTLIRELQDGLLDVIFTVAPKVPSGIVPVASWDFEVKLARSPSLRIPRNPSLAKLADVPFLLYRRGSRFEDMIDRYLSDHSFQPTVTMRLSHAEPMMAMVRLGLGVAFFPEWMLENRDVAKGVRPIHLKEPALLSRISLFRREQQHVPLLLKELIQLAQDWDAKT